MNARNKKIKKISVSILCLLLVLNMIIPVSALYQENYVPQLPTDQYGMDFIVFDETMAPNETGCYDGKMTARLTGNISKALGISGGFVSWFWDSELPEPVLENTPPIGYKYPVQIDTETGMSSQRASFQFNQAADKGVFTEGKSGTGYKEFHLSFANVEAVPGQIFNVKVQDYYSEILGESTLLLSPVDQDEEDPPVIRGNVTEGQLRAPGRTIIYKSDADGTQTYEQVYKTDEELVGKTLLTNEEVGFTGGVDKEFLGWSISPDSVNEVQYRPGQALDEKDSDGRYKIQNLILYPVYQVDEHLEGNWVDYIVYDTKAETDPTLANGRYNAKLNIHIMADMSIISELTQASLEWSWPSRLPDPTLENMPEAAQDNTPSYELPEDSGLGLITHRRIYMWDKKSDHGALTPANDGTGYGYHEFQMVFKNFAGEPGEVIDNIRLRDYFSKNQQASTMNGTSAVTGEEIDTIRCHVKTGSITIPGKKIVYKADDTENAKKYEQIYYSDEEVANATVLGNDPTQNPNQPLTKPNFDVPAGKTFGGWSDQANATEAMYQPGDPLSVMDNMTLYPVWIAKDSYTVTYNGNGGTPDRQTDEVLIGDSIGTLPSAVHPEGYIFLGWFTAAEGGTEVTAPYTPGDNTELYAHWETTYKVIYSAGNGTGTVTDENSPYRKDAYVVVKNSEGLTAPSPDYIFAGWESSVPVRVGNSEKTILSPDDTFRMPEQDITLTAIWDNTISDVCPIVLDLTGETLKNKKGETITSGFVVTKSVIAVTVPAFDACNARHTHELIIKGSTAKEVSIEGDGQTEFNTYVNGVNARILSLDTDGSVTFGNDGAITDSQFYNSAGEGLIFGANVKEVKIIDGIAVTSVSGSAENNPVAGTDGKVKVLDIALHEKPTEDLSMTINSREVTVPADSQRIAILDNLEGTWLKDSIQVTDADGTAYVRGVAENSGDTEYINSDYSDRNLYGSTFDLLGTGINVSDAGERGRYREVRIPQKIQQLKVTVPTRIVFNIYTNGINDSNHGFIAPIVTLNSDSATFEDSLELQTSGGIVVKDYGRKNHRTDVGYLGIKEDGVSSYTLDAYTNVTSDQMNQSVSKPIVCIEAEANTESRPRIVLKQDADYSAQPVSWFSAPTGDTTLQLKVPGDYENGLNTKRYYQIPKDVVDDQDGKTILYGFHKMRLAFSMGEVE